MQMLVAEEESMIVKEREGLSKLLLLSTGHREVEKRTVVYRENV